MTPGMITAAAYLISELVVAGVSLKEILSETEGKVPAEVWARVRQEIADANEMWESN